MKRAYLLSTLLLTLLFGGSLTCQAVIITQMIGDNDGFAGTQGSTATPGQYYQVFQLPTIMPGTYVDEAGMDLETPELYEPYVFDLNFALDLTGFETVDAASLSIQTGSIKREFYRGFGHAEVWLNDNSLGQLYTEDTWFMTEETVKLHTFDLTPFLQPGMLNSFQITLDGSDPLAFGDVFAIDFAQVTVDASGQSVPDGGSSALLLGLVTLGWAGMRRHLPV